MKKEDILKHYLHTALWTEELDGEKDIEDFGTSTVEQAKKDIDSFVEKAGDLLNGWDDEQIGHDFWLTRNGHGAGFWDRDELPNGKELSKICDEFKECNVWVSECDVVYIEQ